MTSFAIISNKGIITSPSIKETPIFLLSSCLQHVKVRFAPPPREGDGEQERFNSSSHRIYLSDDVEVGVSDPCYIYGSQTLMFINGG